MPRGRKLSAASIVETIFRTNTQTKEEEDPNPYNLPPLYQPPLGERILGNRDPTVIPIIGVALDKALNKKKYRRRSASLPAYDRAKFDAENAAFEASLASRVPAQTDNFHFENGLREAQRAIQVARIIAFEEAREKLKHCSCRCVGAFNRFCAPCYTKHPSLPMPCPFGYIFPPRLAINKKDPTKPVVTYPVYDSLNRPIERITCISVADKYVMGPDGVRRVQLSRTICIPVDQEKNVDQEKTEKSDHHEEREPLDVHERRPEREGREGRDRHGEPKPRDERKHRKDHSHPEQAPATAPNAPAAQESEGGRDSFQRGRRVADPGVVPQGKREDPDVPQSVSVLSRLELPAQVSSGVNRRSGTRSVSHSAVFALHDAQIMPSTPRPMSRRAPTEAPAVAPVVAHVVAPVPAANFIFPPQAPYNTNASIHASGPVRVCPPGPESTPAPRVRRVSVTAAAQPSSHTPAFPLAPAPSLAATRTSRAVAGPPPSMSAAHRIRITSDTPSARNRPADSSPSQHRRDDPGSNSSGSSNDHGLSDSASYHAHGYSTSTTSLGSSSASHNQADHPAPPTRNQMYLSSTTAQSKVSIASQPVTDNAKPKLTPMFMSLPSRAAGTSRKPTTDLPAGSKNTIIFMEQKKIDEDRDRKLLDKAEARKLLGTADAQKLVEQAEAKMLLEKAEARKLRREAKEKYREAKQLQDLPPTPIQHPEVAPLRIRKKNAPHNQPL